jgi:hypothetical protein
MKITDLMVDAGADIYYDEAFRRVLEDHMSYLKSHPTTHTVAVEASKAYKYEGDLFGLLTAYLQPVYLHWVIMRMNGFTSPLEASREISSFIAPDQKVINQIRQSHVTRRRIT